MKLYNKFIGTDIEKFNFVVGIHGMKKLKNMLMIVLG